MAARVNRRIKDVRPVYGADQEVNRFSRDVLAAIGADLEAIYAALASVSTGTGVTLSNSTPIIEGGTGSPGASGEASRSDHVHPATSGGVTLSNATPLALGTAAAGGGTAASRNDHVHPHGNLAGGTFHAAATAGTAGFMSGTDKSKLDALTYVWLTIFDIDFSSFASMALPAGTYTMAGVTFDIALQNASAAIVSGVGIVFTTSGAANAFGYVRISSNQFGAQRYYSGTKDYEALAVFSASSAPVVQQIGIIDPPANLTNSDVLVGTNRTYSGSTTRGTFLHRDRTAGQTSPATNATLINAANLTTADNYFTAELRGDNYAVGHSGIESDGLLVKPGLRGSYARTTQEPWIERGSDYYVRFRIQEPNGLGTSYTSGVKSMRLRIRGI